MEREVPPGYEPWGKLGIKLIDPTECPAGHPFTFGQRSYATCAPHHGHPSWRCSCGQMQYLEAGTGRIVAEMECVSR